MTNTVDAHPRGGAGRLLAFGFLLLLLAFLSASPALAQGCAPNPCQNGGLCQDQGGGDFTCRCPAGTSGSLCETVEGGACDPNPCLNSGQCNEDGNGGFSCTCQPGTTGTLCGTIIDPCDPNPCQNDGICEDQGDGIFGCRCTPGFIGQSCDIVNPCFPNPCQNDGSCNIEGESFSCTCPAGTSGDFCEVGTPDLCDPNPCQNGGECLIDQDSGLVCRCPLGFEGEFCGDIGNACEVNQCQNGGTCIDNGDGSFGCDCAEGFEGDLCENETEPEGVCNPNPCLNGGFCFDFNGTAFCNCPAPFSGTTCEIVGDACLLITCQNGATCIDNGDGTATCDCPEGFAGEFCEINLDPCSSVTCENGGTCIDNGDETTSCDCPEGFEGDLCQLVSVDLGLGSLFDEGFGLETDFRSGFTGVLQGDAGWGLGQQGAALNVSGAGYVEVTDPGADTALDITDALTVLLWIRPDDLGGTQMLVSKDNAYELEIGKISSDTSWDLRLGNVVAGESTTPITEGLWQHVAATWDGTTVTYYHNGQAAGTGSHTAPLPSNDSSIGVGARPAPPTSGGPTFFFTGAIDDVRIFDRALSAEEISSIFDATVDDITPPVRSAALPGGPVAAGSTSTTLGLSTDEAATCRYGTAEGADYGDLPEVFPGSEGAVSHSVSLSGLTDNSIERYFSRCRDSLGNRNGDDFDLSFAVGNVDLLSDLAGFWAFDEASGCDALDATGVHDGSLGPDCLGGNGPQYIDGVVGSALSFDGTDDQVAAPTSAAIATPSEITIAAWIRRGTSFRFESIVDFRDQGTDGYDLYTTNSSRLFLRVNDGALTGSSVVTDGAWHHVVGVYDGNHMRLYVDGNLDATSTVGAKSIDVGALQLYIGRHFSLNTFGFTGNIDEVMLYTRGLSDIEVFETFMAGRR